MSDEGKSCCSGGKFPWKCLYAVLHILILTCIATSLWQISGHLAEMASK